MMTFLSDLEASVEKAKQVSSSSSRSLALSLSLCPPTPPHTAPELRWPSQRSDTDDVPGVPLASRQVPWLSLAADILRALQRHGPERPSRGGGSAPPGPTEPSTSLPATLALQRFVESSSRAARGWPLVGL
eukprot:2689094-Rhodomonas_salina.2